MTEQQADEMIRAIKWVPFNFLVSCLALFLIIVFAYAAISAWSDNHR